MKARTDTRRLYRFEQLFLCKRNNPGNRDTPVAELRALASRVWEENNKKLSRECPQIIAGKGLFEQGITYSYYEVDPVHKIVLSRCQRTPTILLHELTHALGRGLHDEKFCALYFKLLSKYLGYDLEELKLQASLYKIKTAA